MKTITAAVTIRRLIATAVVSAVCSTFAALPVTAADTSIQDRTVSYSDLDVSSSHGASVLYSRIRTAAEAACSPYVQSDFVSVMHMHACVNTAIGNAVASVNVPALTGIYLAKDSKRAPTQIASL